MHRNLSIRSRKGTDDDKATPAKHRFAISSLRSLQQPELSKKLYKLIKSENHAISAHDTAARERLAVANQLSEWGESTEDDAVSEISDKLGVLLAEIGEQEDQFAHGLEDARTVLKQIRNTESSVQPSRDNKQKVADELAKLKHKEPTSTKIVTLEQELVRAEAQSLVAEAQLTNTTRQKLKEAYLLQTAVLLERCEKQALLAKQARRIVEMLDDTPVQPGDKHQDFARYEETRQVLNDAEDELRNWSPSWERNVTGTEQVASPVEAGHSEQVGAPAQHEAGAGSSIVASDGSVVGTESEYREASDAGVAATSASHVASA